LKAERGKSMVLIVLYTWPGSLERLRQLAEAAPALAKAGVRVVAAPLGAESAVAAEPGDAKLLAPILATVGPEMAATYSLYRRTPSIEGVPPMPEHLEFLIDRQGYLRFRWNPEDGGGWGQVAALIERVEALNKEPPRPPAPEGGHVHGS
jgi:putative copper resistance protein D